jgi:hypothetical protein
MGRVRRNGGLERVAAALRHGMVEMVWDVRQGLKLSAGAPTLGSGAKVYFQFGITGYVLGDSGS